MAEPYKRKEVIGNATLYLGDCLEILPTLEKVDAVITDPPYGIGLGKIKSRIGKNVGYESFDDTPEYVSNVAVKAIVDCIDMFKRVICTPGSRCAFSYPQPDEIGCIYIPSGAGLGRWGFITSHPVLYYGTDPYKRQKPTSMASYSAISDKNDHPCPKPDSWMNWLVGRASLDAECVLDPFMGSGTTGVACMNLGRKFIGIEIEPKYFDIACERIENAQRQVSMFDNYDEVQRAEFDQEDLL